jgi:ABC-type polysaccharide/polyol phosphate transport system ATPase subunit
MADPVIVANGVGKRYRLYRRRNRSLKELVVRHSLGEWQDLWAVRDVSFEVPQGQFLGIIGKNGSGKSTLLKLLAQILRPDTGSLAMRGRVSSLLELGAGFHPEYTGRENVYLYGAMLGLRRQEIDEQYRSILEFSELGDFIEYPVKNYSSGMYMRLGFSVAVHLKPDVLLVDEVLAVGDAAFQQKCYEHLRRLVKGGCTIILVSHDLQAVGQFCERAIWLDHGRVMTDGSTDRTIETYLDASAEDAARVRNADGLVDAAAGTPDIVITSVRYLDQRGRETRVVESGDPLRLEIGYMATERLDALEVGVTVFRNDGVRCLDAQLFTRREKMRIEPGGGRLVLDFPSFSLQRGQYETTVAMFDPVKQRFQQFHDRLHPFAVKDERGVGGVVWLDYRWTLEAGDAFVQRLA